MFTIVLHVKFGFIFHLNLWEMEKYYVIKVCRVISVINIMRIKAWIFEGKVIFE